MQKRWHQSTQQVKVVIYILKINFNITLGSRDMKIALSKCAAIQDSHSQQFPKKKRAYKKRISKAGAGSGGGAEAWNEEDASDQSSEEDASDSKKPKKKLVKEIKITHHTAVSNVVDRNYSQTFLSSQSPDSSLSQDPKLFSPHHNNERSSLPIPQLTPEESLKAQRTYRLSILEKSNVLLERMLKMHPDGTEQHEKYQGLFEANVMEQLDIMAMMN